MSNPALRAANKASITHAAAGLGISPKEGQEASWAATLNVSALKRILGVNHPAVASLVHPAAIRAAWDHTAVLDKPEQREMLKTAGIDDKHIDRVMADHRARQDARDPGGAAAVPKGLADAYAAVTSRIPPMSDGPTYTAINEAIRPLLKRRRRVAAGDPTGPFPE